MSKLLRLILPLIMAAVPAFAQQTPQVPPTAIVNGIIYANAYGGWSVPQGNNAPFAWSSPAACTVSQAGISFPAFTVGTPIETIDQVTPSHNEKVTVTAVNVNPESCSITTTAPTFTHTQFQLASATAGLQEALNQSLGTQFANVIALTKDWYQLGGQTAMIGQVTGNTKLGIVDVTTTPYDWYSWQSTAYVLVPVGGGACTGGCVTQLNGLQNIVNLVAGAGVSVTPDGQNIIIANTNPGGSSCEDGCVTSLNGVQGVTQLIPGSNISISVSGQGITINSTAAGTPGGPWNIARYGSQTGTALPSPSPNLFQVDSSTTLAQMNALIASLNIYPSNPPGGPYVGAGTITIGDATPLVGWTNNTSSSNAGVGFNDIRTGVQTTPLSTWGVPAGAGSSGCATGSGSWIFTQGSTTVSPSFNSFSAADVGNTLVVVGTYNGLPTRFTPTIASFNAGTGNVTISTPAPFSGNIGGIKGFLATSAMASAMSGLAAGDLVGQVPAGCVILTGPIQWTTAQSLVGEGSGNSTIAGLPGEDIFVNPDTPGTGVTGDGLRFGHMKLAVNGNIDATHPWQAIDAAGNLTTRAALNRPLGNHSAAANNPLGAGWAANASLGVGAITNGSAVMCVPNTLTRPVVGQQLLFRDTPAIFKTTASSLSGSGCATGTSPVTMANAAPATIAQAEWLSTTQVQSLAVALTAGAMTYPKTITVSNSVSPAPGFESNVATHGRFKLGNEEYDYYGTGGNTINLAAGPSTTAGWAIGTALMPENPCYVDHETPWPVTPTVNSGDSTPSGAVYFPAYCGGNAAIAMPTANGNVYHGTGFSHAMIQDLIMIQNGLVDGNNTQGMYVAGNNAPYSTTFDRINVEDTTFGITQGPASSGQHGVAAALVTGQGNIYYNVEILGAYNVILNNMNGGEFGIKDMNTTGLNPFDGSVNGAVTSGIYGYSLDEQTGNLVSNTAFIQTNNYNSEPENGNNREIPFYFMSDCTQCIFINSNFEGAGSVFGGSYQQVIGGQLSQPVINYGTHNLFPNTTETINGPVTNTWPCQYCEWGTFSQASPYSGYGGGPQQNAGIGDHQPYDGDDSQTFFTGNFQGSGFNPYGNLKASYIKPEEWNMNGQYGGVMSVGKTLDSTELDTGAYVACNITTGSDCNIQNFGSPGQIYIGAHDRLRPISYDLAIDMETPSGTTQFVMYITGANPIGGSCSSGNIAFVSIMTTSAWSTYHIPVNLAAWAGCTLGIQFGPTFSGSAQLRVGATQFVPTPGWVNAASFTYTVGANSPGGLPGPILSTDNNGIYWAGADGKIHSTSTGSGINQLTGDVTAGPGTGSVPATVVSTNGGTPFTSQIAGPECNSGASGQLGPCTNGVFPGTVINGVYTVPSLASAVFNITQGNAQSLTLAQNTTSTLTGGSLGGQFVSFEIAENSTGGYSFSWPSNFVGFPAINTAASARTVVSGYYDGASVYASGTFLNPMTALGDTIYGGTAGAPSRVPGNTTVTPGFYSETGTGSVAATPSWVPSSGSGNVCLTINCQMTTPNIGAATGTSLVLGGTGPHGWSLPYGTGTFPYTVPANSVGWHSPVATGTSYFFTPPGTWTGGFLYAAPPAPGADSTNQAVISPVYPEATLPGGAGAFGTYTATTYIGGTKMTNAGSFTNIEIANTSTSSCTTAPTFNVVDITTSTNGTNPVTGSTTGAITGTTVFGNPGLNYAAGDEVKLIVSATGATCPNTYNVNAQYVTK